MATYVRGVENDLTVAQTQRVRDVRPGLSQLEPNAAPFTTVQMRLSGGETTYSVKKEWLEDRLPARLVKLAANASGGGAVSPAYSAVNVNFSFLVANDSDVICVDDLLKHEVTGEVVLVTAIGTKGGTNADYTVRRNVGNTGSALSPTSGQGQTGTPAGNDTYIVIGNARQQGAKLGTPVVTQVTAQYNICQIVRHPIAVTRTEAQSKNYSGPEYERQMAKAMVVHKRAKEEMCLHGRRDLYAVSDETVSVRGTIHPRGTMGGVLAFLGAGTGSQISDVSSAGTASQKQIDDWLETSFRYGADDNKIIICGPMFARLISSFPGNQGLYTTTTTQQVGGRVISQSPDVDHWGVAIKRYQTGIGDSVKLIVARTWSDYADASVATKSLKGSALLLDMDNIDLTYFVGGQTQELRNRQDNDEDSSAGEILSDMTLQFRLPETHGWLYGLKSASVYN
jgi:hypothetical protein